MNQSNMISRSLTGMSGYLMEIGLYYYQILLTSYRLDPINKAGFIMFIEDGDS